MVLTREGPGLWINSSPCESAATPLQYRLAYNEDLDKDNKKSSKTLENSHGSMS